MTLNASKSIKIIFRGNRKRCRPVRRRHDA